jgi:hypothetical protein
LSEGLYTLWGNEEAQKDQGSPTALSKEFVRKAAARDVGGCLPHSFLGAPMDFGDPLPEYLVELLEQRLGEHDSRTNLLEYGCVAQFPSRMDGKQDEQAAWLAGKGYGQ